MEFIESNNIQQNEKEDCKDNKIIKDKLRRFFN